MKSSPILLSLIAVAFLSFNSALGGDECTTAVITGAATADGRPLLWKNRDADNLSNKVIFVREKPYSYLGVIDAADTSGRIIWGGLNEAGFAIINSVSYNLPKRSGEYVDLEGHVMGDALRTCTTVDDFENYVTRNLGTRFGCRTNFCVIDAQGGACIFEVSNHGFKKLDANQSEGKCLLNTNFSRTGEADQGAGYLRFDRETALFATVPPGRLSHEFILQTAARDLGHVLLRHPGRAEWKKLPADVPYWIHTNHTINRDATACTILVHGAKKGEDPLRATLWVILGEPVCSIALPFWVGAGETPSEVREGKDAPIVQEESRLKGILRPLKGSDRGEYLDLRRLDNAKGTGWLPAIESVEREILGETARFTERPFSGQECAAFQRRMAVKAYRALQGIK